MTHPIKILVFGSENLLNAGIFSLLTSRSEFEVTRTTFESLANLEPSSTQELDMVILPEELLAANILALIQMVNCYPNLRLIILSLKNHNVNIFDKQTIPVRNTGDFIQLLLSGSPKNRPD